MRHFIFLAIATFVFIFNAYAKDGSSGCGPGWFILKKNSLVSSALRGTTNGALAPLVTLGMTLGTSQCSKHSIVKTEKRAIHYVTNNYYELESEIAKGNGVYLSGLAETIGCGVQAQKTFNSKLRTKYKKIFSGSDKSAEFLLLEVYKTILTDKELMKACSLS